LKLRRLISLPAEESTTRALPAGKALIALAEVTAARFVEAAAIPTVPTRIR
jgi:hypothetical protein